MSKELLFDPNAIREALKRQREKHTKEVCQKVGPTMKMTPNSRKMTTKCTTS